MKIYTKSGDKGQTSLIGGIRVPKHHIRIESYGTLDELNSWLGLIRDQDIGARQRGILIRVQENLFTLSALMATAPEKAFLKSGRPRIAIPGMDKAPAELLEKEIDHMNEKLPPMTHFILPGGHISVSFCHIARTVCRRAERKMSLLHEEEPLPEDFLSYINRLSDYLFVLARKLAMDNGIDEIKWVPGQKS